MLPALLINQATQMKSWLNLIQLININTLFSILSIILKIIKNMGDLIDRVVHLR